MATTAHYIYSDYKEDEDKARLESETGQQSAEADLEDPWLTANTFGVSKRVANPPRFVPAVVGYDEWESIAGPSTLKLQEPTPVHEEEEVSSWYRSLTRKAPSSGLHSAASTSRAETPVEEPKPSSSQPHRKRVVRDKDNWFISRVLENEAARSTSSSPGPTATPTLADILSREPPPEPSEKPFKPPVFLAIGPGNRGFEMLAKTGWEEGDPLGRRAPRRGLGYRPSSAPAEIDASSSKPQEPPDAARTPDMSKEVIDLTLSDDEEETEFEFVPAVACPRPEPTRTNLKTEDDVDLDHNPRALITPLPTILKADRLGIGLKAKTSGPYRESVKKVTHSQKALAAHIKANEERKRLKNQVGRGSRGFERLKKKEAQERRNLLSYMNN